jgi:plastocyanin
MPAMRRPTALAGFCAAAFAVAVFAPAAAQARTDIVRLQSKPFTLSGFATIFPKVAVPTPQRSGYITRMDAWLVNDRGVRVSIRDVMLHHVVFINVGAPGVDKNGSCPGRGGEPFWGTGEEKQPLLLPEGYGYKIAGGDRWRMQAMLMSHSLRAHRVRVVYKLRVVVGAQLKRVKPLWLRANGCTKHPSYDIEGDQVPSSVHTKSSLWRMPISGRIVAAAAHLHGSSMKMMVDQPRCQDRTLIEHRPLYGFRDDIVYRARPVLHEPGPIATGHFLSKTGIPVRKGEMLKVTGLYDASRPHVQVMAITHVYIAPDREAPRACTPIPTDAHIFWTRKDGRFNPPWAPVPLNGLGDDGQVHEIERPPGDPRVVNGPQTLVTLTNQQFKPANLSVPRGTDVVWRFTDSGLHNVMLASGPRLVSSTNQRKGFRYVRKLYAPGTYKLFCYLHPITMTQVIEVRP